MNKDYTDRIEERTDQAYAVAEEARSQKKDPESHVDVPVAEDLAAKAVGLVTADQFPELEGQGVEDRIRELEDEYGKNDERVALVIGKEIAQEAFYDFDDKETAIDAGLRIGLSYMTGGIVTAPLEGIADVELRDNDDGSQYLAVHYAGPIRSAGGTASAMSVLLADYIRKEVDVAAYETREQEVKRYATEVEDYFSRVTKKQYTPERQETEMIAKNVPVEITGTPTEQLEVSNYKDLPRVHTNRIRGGMCLVYLDGLPLKASKIKKRIKSYGEEFGLEHWEWIEDYLELQHEIHASGDEDEDDEADDDADMAYEPNDKYMGNIVGGRPVFAHPGATGGFRLRYGRSRTAGLAAIAFHPATTEIADRFMALGTQLKTEYPGKASMVTPCDSIEPPIVRLENGDVIQVETREQARELIDDIDTVLFLGDVLVPYGEFLENGKDLLPSPYVAEWWALDVKDALDDHDGDMDLDAYVEKPYETPTARSAVAFSRKLAVPLHPQHTYFWDNLDMDDFEDLHHAVREGSDGRLDVAAKDALEELYVPHEVDEDAVIVDDDVYFILNELLCPDDTDPADFAGDIREAIADVSGITVKEKAPIFLGNRMGRPEKAERRWLKGKPQLLFPCGREEGGRMRNLMETYKAGTVNADIFNQYCPDCDRTVHYSYCPFCGKEADDLYKCRECGQKTEEEMHCGTETIRSWHEDVHVRDLLDQARENLDLRELPDLLKSPRGVTGRHKHVEPIEKGLLRQKYDLYVNKDGTIRYDAIDIPMTHFKPQEINVPVEKLRKLGYEEDINGEPLEDADQVVELKYQDIIIPETVGEEGVPAAEYMLRVAKFVDELLEDFYGLEPYYEAETQEDILGSLVVGLAPHTSAGTVGRIIGFSNAKGIHAHPYWHAAKRRNCDGDEDSILMLMDALLNFSRQFLPDQRGTRTMDAPLILSTVLLPDEVDDEAWNVDVVDQYSKEFYEATHEMKAPWEVDITVAEDIIDEDVSFGYTHPTSDIRDAPQESAYVSLGDMSEKTTAQLDLAERFEAVDEHDVAEMIIEKHFLRDIKGNLRAFSEQRFRCVNCNEKFRRAPLKGRCTNCGQKLLLTVSEGAIKKYLYPSEDIADKYRISPYLRQQLMILKENIQSLFGKDDRQSDLDQFIQS